MRWAHRPAPAVLGSVGRAADGVFFFSLKKKTTQQNGDIACSRTREACFLGGGGGHCRGSLLARLNVAACASSVSRLVAVSPVNKGKSERARETRGVRSLEGRPAASFVGIFVTPPVLLCACLFAQVRAGLRRQPPAPLAGAGKHAPGGGRGAARPAMCSSPGPAAWHIQQLAGGGDGGGGALFGQAAGGERGVGGEGPVRWHVKNHEKQAPPHTHTHTHSSCLHPPGREHVPHVCVRVRGHHTGIGIRSHLQLVQGPRQLLLLFVRVETVVKVFFFPFPGDNV